MDSVLQWVDEAPEGAEAGGNAGYMTKIGDQLEVDIEPSGIPPAMLSVDEFRWALEMWDQARMHRWRNKTVTYGKS